MDGSRYRVDIPKSLSRIHCPDDNREDTETELKILLKSGIMNNENMLGTIDIENVLKYGSIMGFNQDSKEQRPDIATFERLRMEETLSRE